jgi:hypothetical protein
LTGNLKKLAAVLALRGADSRCNSSALPVNSANSDAAGAGKFFKPRQGICPPGQGILSPGRELSGTARMFWRRRTWPPAVDPDVTMVIVALTTASQAFLNATVVLYHIRAC